MNNPQNPTAPTPEELEREQEEEALRHIVSKRLGDGLPGFTYLAATNTEEDLRNIHNAVNQHFSHQHYSATNNPFARADVENRKVILRRPDDQTVTVHDEGMDFDTEVAHHKPSIAHAMSLIPLHVHTITLKG